MREPNDTSQLPSVPSDVLPLAVMAGIVICFMLHFGTRLLKQLEADQTMPARPRTALGAYDLEICNGTSRGRVYVAVAYFDPLRNDWVARGWFPQRQGECQLTMRKLVPPVYVFAETEDGQARWGEGETGRGAVMEFCINRDKAFVEGQARCAPGEGKRQRFAELSLSGAEASGLKFRWELKDGP